MVALTAVMHWWPWCFSVVVVGGVGVGVGVPAVLCTVGSCDQQHQPRLFAGKISVHVVYYAYDWNSYDMCPSDTLEWFCPHPPMLCLFGVFACLSRLVKALVPEGGSGAIGGATTVIFDPAANGKRWVPKFDTKFYQFLSYGR